MDTKTIVNTLYDGAIITGLTIVYAMVGEKIMRTEIGDPGKPTFNRFLKLSGAIVGAVATKDYLEQKNIIPAEPDL